MIIIKYRISNFIKSIFFYCPKFFCRKNKKVSPGPIMQCKVVSGDDTRFFYLKIINFYCNHWSELKKVIIDINLFDETLI